VITVRIGILFPHYELGDDAPGTAAAAAATYARTVEDAGFAHLAMHDHILGADVTNRPEWQGPYNVTHAFHEPFVLMGYLAAVTERLEFLTDILVLPQRQTPLVAKQAAEVDVLSQGRLRLGVGVGYTPIEFEGLGVDYATRGARFDEQLEVLRLLWTQDVVSYHGRFHTLDAVGIRPLPVQRPIPLWLGGGDGATQHALRRIGRLADGWLPSLVPGVDDEALKRTMDTVMSAAAGSGRDPGDLEIDGMVQVSKPFDPKETEARMRAWMDFGATRITFRCLDVGYRFDEHLDVASKLATYADW
jgi:probable F420-dependent oxidoreductase